MKVQPNEFKFSVTTPKGVASFPRLNAPIKWVNNKCVVATEDDADANYEIDVVLPAADAQPIIDKAQAALDAFKAEVVAELAAGNPQQKKKSREVETNAIGKPDLDSDGNETGKVKIKFKMKAAGTKKDGSVFTRKPILFDAHSKTPLKKAPNVGGGSVVRVAGTAMPYYMANGNAVGVTFYLDAVQIIELRQFGGRDAGAFGFGEEEGGFAAEAATPFDDSAAGDDAPAGDESDDF